MTESVIEFIDAKSSSSNLEVMPPGTPKCISPDLSQHEPPMNLPRPSSDRAQDVSHILASMFQDLYTRDVMSKDTVQNLTGSSEGSTAFHKKCMNQLKKIHDEHKQKLEEYNMLERHIIQARARAASADAKALSHIAGDVGVETYGHLGLPPVKSNFRWCLSEDKLKEHKLIVPSDLFSEEQSLSDGPKKPTTPRFRLPTVSSSMRFLKESVDDGFVDASEASLQRSLLDTDKSSLTFGEYGSDSDQLVTSKSSQSGKNIHRWQENMKHENRIKDREMLARLEERHNFLKNPRFLPITEPKASRLLTKESSKQLVLKAGRKIHQDCKTDYEVQVFESSPHTVMFTEWIVGRVYETSLDLRNISTVGRHLRVLPPKTQYFSIGLGKYPGPEGVVAPGISTQYNIRFMPDSLANYEDEIQVLTQATRPLVIKIKAIRSPPTLTISEKFQCGYCLVGGIKNTELPIKNVGGSGRFCILKKSMWPAANFKTAVNPGCLDLGVFQIRPAVFEVMVGESVTLELLFAPDDTKLYKEELVLVCDNCQVKYFTIEGEGERAAVELVSVSDGGEGAHRVGEISDLTADHFVQFPSLNPHSFYMRQLIVHNTTNVDMPFSWHILKPNLTSGINFLSSEDIDWEQLEFYPDDASPFFIEPKSGSLQPNGIHEFVLTFAPHQVGTYNNVFHLVLSDIPDSKLDSKQQVTIGKLPPPIGLLEKQNHVGLDESAVSPPTPSRSNSITQASISSKVPSFRKVIALEVEVKGQSIPYSVLLQPSVIVIPGNILTGATAKRPLRMANYSLAPVQYNWSNECSPDIIEVKPPIGLINPGEIADLEVSVTGSQPGHLSGELVCNIEHQETPLSLNVSADIIGPTVVIDNMSLNYGLFILGTSPTESLYIRNTTQLNAQWSLTQHDEENSELIIWPSSGELTALGKQEIKVTFKPQSCQSLDTCLNLKVVGGQGSSIKVKGEVQTQQVCFRECILKLEDTFQSVPKTATAVMINQTCFPTAFSFLDFKGLESCEVSVQPEKGVLGPREEKLINVTFVSHKEGSITNAYQPCLIEGMEKPIALGFYADVQVLSVQYSTPNYTGSGLKVVFEDSVKVGSTQTSTIFITNETAIRAPWSAAVEFFKAHKPTTRKYHHDFKSVKSRRALLGRTPNLADPLAKTPAQAEAEHRRIVLGGDQGAAFVVKPSRGFIEPYQVVEISVVAYCEMWGNYQDVIVIQVKGLEPQRIPVELNVTGSPLSFQVANNNQKDAVVRYGTHLEGGASVSRKLRVNNRSCYDIRLDWRTYNYPEPDDKKILDLNVWFGEAFPLQAKSSRGSLKSSSSQSLNLVSDNVSAHDTAKSESATDIESKVMKLVNVLVEPHLGSRSNTPFYIEPDQIIVPARGHVTVSSIFQPVMDRCNNNTGRECLGYALGFMSLDNDRLKLQRGKVSRCDGYSTDPLRLELSGSIHAGMLNVETSEDEDHSSFHLQLCDILTEDERINECVQEETCNLSNQTETILNFRLSVNKPFYLVGDSPNTKVLSLSRNSLPAKAVMKLLRASNTVADVLKIFESVCGVWRKDNFLFLKVMKVKWLLAEKRLEKCENEFESFFAEVADVYGRCSRLIQSVE